jgi:hypothetical protein
MGFETFRVELRGERANYQEVNEAVRKFPNSQPDLHSISMTGSTYYVINDGRHVIEVEVMDSPVKLSCRFTLCHPPSVDAAFLGVVRELMMRLGLQARVCDDVRPEHARAFSLDEFAEFAGVTSHYTATRRAEWIAAFGSDTMAATTNEVYQRVILPRCQPVLKRPT